MLKKILKKIEEYEAVSENLRKMYIEIKNEFSKSIDDINKYLEDLDLDESEKFYSEYYLFLDDDTRKIVRDLIDNKKTKATYMPILNKLSEFGFSNKKIIKLDEFLEKYIEPTFGWESKSETLSLRASGFYNILSGDDKYVLYKFLIDNKIAQPILTYYCFGEHEDDYFSKEIEFRKKDIEKIKALLEFRNKEGENSDEEYYDKLEELENDVISYCPVCGNEIDFEEVISDFNELYKGDKITTLELL